MIQDVFGTVRAIKTEAYYVLSASIHLFSPQDYFQENNGGQCVIHPRTTVLTLACGSELVFPYNGGSNLPLMLPSLACNVAGMTFEDASYLSENNGAFACMSVADETNQNLTQAQRELLLWHWKLGHAGMGWVQELLARPRDEDRR